MLFRSIDQATFDKAQAVLHERHVLSGTKNDNNNRYLFSSILQCGVCGKKYKRKAREGKASWQCSTSLNVGKTACPAKQVPESVLYKVSAEVLGLDEIDAEKFTKEIAEILVPGSNKLIYVFRDGNTTEKVWQHKSRRGSWTDEMREAAREYARRRPCAWHQV